LYIFNFIFYVKDSLGTSGISGPVKAKNIYKNYRKPKKGALSHVRARVANAMPFALGQGLPMDKQHIIEEIKRTAESNGGQPLGKDRFSSETGIQMSDWYGKHWARWGDALIEAGYEPNKFRGAYNDDWVIERFISLIRELGRFPVSGELRIKAKQDKGFPAHNVFNRLGKKSELAYKILKYCRKREGFNDIVRICEPIADTAKADSSVSTEQTEIGYVYLM
jgi:hypothetical protein